MPMLIIRHKVGEFGKWKQAYDAHADTRAANGVISGRVTRSADDPSQLVLLFEIADIAKAKAFIASPDLKSAMEAAGVIDKPDFYYLNDA